MLDCLRNEQKGAHPNILLKDLEVLFTVHLDLGDRVGGCWGWQERTAPALLSLQAAVIALLWPGFWKRAHASWGPLPFSCTWGPALP